MFIEATVSFKRYDRFYKFVNVMQLSDVSLSQSIALNTFNEFYPLNKEKY